MREALTCDLEGGVPASHAAVLVARHAVVHPGVQLEARVQEEEAPVGQLNDEWRGGMLILRRLRNDVNRFVNKLFLHLSVWRLPSFFSD